MRECSTALIMRWKSRGGLLNSSGTVLPFLFSSLVTWSATFLLLFLLFCLLLLLLCIRLLLFLWLLLLLLNYCWNSSITTQRYTEIRVNIRLTPKRLRSYIYFDSPFTKSLTLACIQNVCWWEKTAYFRCVAEDCGHLQYFSKAKQMKVHFTHIQVQILFQLRSKYYIAWDG